MSKYYAVRNGRHTGIFHTWEECRKRGYRVTSGAEYKDFRALTMPKQYKWKPF